MPAKTILAADAVNLARRALKSRAEKIAFGGHNDRDAALTIAALSAVIVTVRGPRRIRATINPGHFHTRATEAVDTALDIDLTQIGADPRTAERATIEVIDDLTHDLTW